MQAELISVNWCCVVELTLILEFVGSPYWNTAAFDANRKEHALYWI
jgi:hypothetical protein